MRAGMRPGHFDIFIVLAFAALQGLGADGSPSVHIVRASEPDALRESCWLIDYESHQTNIQKEIERAKALAARGNSVCAWRIIGHAACKLRDLKLVDDAYKRVDEPGREFLIYACEREGIRRVRGRFERVEQQPGGGGAGRQGVRGRGAIERAGRRVPCGYPGPGSRRSRADRGPGSERAERRTVLASWLS